MSIIDDINRIRSITNSSFVGVVNTSNFDFQLIAKILRKLIGQLQLEDGTINIKGATVEELNISEFLNVGGNNFQINDKGNVIAKSIVSQINEVKRLQFKDFPSYPNNGRAGEIIWTGSDFLGYTGSQWKSLTQSSSATANIGIQDSDTDILSSVSTINFGKNLKVVDEGNNKVRINVKNIDTTNYFVNSNPVPETIGGIKAGKTFGKNDNNGSKYKVEDVLNILLYPYQQPTISGSTNISSIVQVGTSIDQLTMSWNITNSQNIQANSIKVYDDLSTDIANNQSISNGSGSVQHSYSTPIKYNNISSFSWYVEAIAIDKDGSTFNIKDSDTVYWRRSR
jgi:hypothetical protein